MHPNHNLRIFLILFIPLAFFVSLFPPFEWGNEKLRTLQERKSNLNIQDKLPIKTYDLLFNSNKKYFILNQSEVKKKFYYYEKIDIEKSLIDAISSNFTTGVDTFKTSYLIGYKKSEEELAQEKRNKTNYSKDVFLSTLRRTYARQNEWNITTAANYKEIQFDYKKEPNAWTTRSETKIDSVVEYFDYKIIKPGYFLLTRRLIITELIINYILSLLVSSMASLIIINFIKSKQKGSEA